MKTTLSITLISLAFSAIFLWRLVVTNPKRRRTHGLQAVAQDKERNRLLWILSLSPALPLLIAQFFSALVMWLAGLLLIGWLMAVVPPRQSKYQ